MPAGDFSEVAVLGTGCYLMPKLACPCGFVHNLSPIPDDGFRVFRDTELVNAQNANQSIDDFADLGTLMYECPECGRLMWDKTAENKHVVYVPAQLPG